MTACEPGDILCWSDVHMGIAVSATRFVCASTSQNPMPLQTAVFDIEGFFTYPPVILRLRAVADEGSTRGNQQAAALLAGRYGWSPSQNPAQWAALDKLWTRESGWSITATNPTTGAYGIAQALPPDKYATAGKAWRTSAAIQIRWGLEYIRQRYGTPEAAWAHEQAHGWY
jgi:hypothetical protein